MGMGTLVFAAALDRAAGTTPQDLAHYFPYDGSARGSQAQMMLYVVLKFVHLIGAAVLLGTGAGIAFFMLMAHLAGDKQGILTVARIVVIADFLFTATAVILQPVTGIALAWQMGWSLREGWVALSIVLYLVAGAFWLPVVWIQMRIRDLASAAVTARASLPPEYHRLFWTWFCFGVPAFTAVLGIFWLMIAKPSINLG